MDRAALGPYPRYRNQHLEAGQLPLLGKAKELYAILPHLQPSEQPYLSSQRRKGGEGVGSGKAFVSHAAALHYRQICLQMVTLPCTL